MLKVCFELGIKNFKTFEKINNIAVHCVDDKDDEKIFSDNSIDTLLRIGLQQKSLKLFTALIKLGKNVQSS